MMKLEKLIPQGREHLAPFPIPDEELLSRHEQPYTGATSDALREFALLDQALSGHIKPLRSERTVAGPAFTVKSAPNVKITTRRRSTSFYVWFPREVLGHSAVSAACENFI